MSKKVEHNLFCDFLTALEVPYTYTYSAGRFADMPFQSVFGLSKLLESYGVKNESLEIKDKSELNNLQPPFLAKLDGGFVIVENTGGGKVKYMSHGVEETMPEEEFLGKWTGVVLLAFPEGDACEFDYSKHRVIELLKGTLKWVFWMCAMFLLIMGCLNCGAFDNAGVALVVFFDLAGLYFTYLLVQKSAHVENDHAERVCGVLQQGGCNDVLATSASKFFGLFGWSEVGFSYFSVSLGTLLLFPGQLGMLALFNCLCLPFTVWSIWYQKFRAKAWCTLCVGVQTTLWILFFSYLISGVWNGFRFSAVSFFTIGALYLGVMLAVNKLAVFIDKLQSNEEA